VTSRPARPASFGDGRTRCITANDEAARRPEVVGIVPNPATLTYLVDALQLEQYDERAVRAAWCRATRQRLCPKVNSVATLVPAATRDRAAAVAGF